MSGLAERSKVNLIYSHCHIRLNISSENNDNGLSSFQKATFQKFPHLNALGSKFDLDVNLGSSFEQTW